MTSEDVRTEIARPEDLDSVLPLLAAQLDEFSQALPHAVFLRTVERALADDGRALVLLARQGELAVGVAYLSFQWTLEGGGWAAWLEELYVVPELRGQGIGGRLLEAAIDAARARDCGFVELETENRLPRAGRLYARAGFEPLSKVRWSLEVPPRVARTG